MKKEERNIKHFIHSGKRIFKILLKMFCKTAAMEDKRCGWNLKHNKGTTFTLTLTRVSIRYEIVCIIQNLFTAARFTA